MAVEAGVSLAPVFLLLAIALSSETLAGWPVSDQFKHAGRIISLENRSGRCYAVDTQRRQVVDMNISAPCRFLHRGDSPEVTVQKYKGVGAVVAVAGKPIDETQLGELRKLYPDLKAGAGCSTELRGLILPDRRPMYASYECYKESKYVFWYRTGEDEKVYYGLAHHKHPRFKCD